MRFILTLLLLSTLTYGASEYTVQKGDTLTKIAKKFKVTTEQLLIQNSIKNANMLSIGQKLVIPSQGKQEVVTETPTSYTVKKGDTFYRIAKALSVNVEVLKKANPSVNPSKIYPGQAIAVPSTATVEPSPKTNTAVVVEEDSPKAATQKNTPSVTKNIPEPMSQPKYKLVVITKQVSFGEFAQSQQMTVSEVNKLNGWNYEASTLLASGSEAYVVSK